MQELKEHIDLALNDTMFIPVATAACKLLILDSMNKIIHKHCYGLELMGCEQEAAHEMYEFHKFVYYDNKNK